MALLKYESQVRPPLVEGNKDYHQVTEDICRPVEAAPSRLWWIGFLISVALLLFGVYSVYREVVYGTGQWNLNRTIGWGWDITNFVWWVGIGHAGTLISAILLLFRQGWRTGVNRAAEAMTIFAVMCAGQFPIWHMGRVWMAFFTLPYPNTRGPLWVNFTSPLLWDVFAISTYFTVSLLFWYAGLLPDLASVRDRAKVKWRKRFYGIAAFFIAVFFLTKGGGSATNMYIICMGLGFGSGISVQYITMSAEQFGTNIRATAAISIPNMVRGCLPLIILLFQLLRSKIFTGAHSYITAAWVTGIVKMCIGFVAALYTKDTFGKDLNFVEQ